MEKVLVVYYSTTGNTKAMAEAFCEGLTQSGAQAECVNAETSPSLEGYDKIAFGCPAMGSEELEEAVFEPYFAQIESQLSGRKTALFGSYGWGGGQWMETWQNRAEQNGAVVFENGCIVNGAPGGSDLESCRQFAQRFAAF